MAIDEYVGGNMSKEKEKEFEVEPRKPHEVPEEEKRLYKSILKEVFVPKLHKQTFRVHHKAHRKAIETLQDKLEKIEEGKEYLEEFDAKEALAHALITYRKEAGIPVSDKEEDFHRIYQEVDQYLHMLKDSKNNIDVDKLIREGNIEELLRHIHTIELSKTIKGRVKYHLDKRIVSGRDHKHYQNLYKMYENEIGEESSDGEIAKIGRTEVIDILMQSYDVKMAKVMEKYTKHQATRYHDKHPEDAKKAA